MTSDALQHFLDERSLTRKELGAALEISQDRLRRFLTGQQPIPRHISLALAAMAYGLPEWPARS
jgi:plasmid maintenance system antidote protein VapI